MDKKNLIVKVIKTLDKEYGDWRTELNYETNFQLVVAVILSAQCTDARVNMVTKKLFVKLKSPQDFVDISQKELEKLIFSTGFYRNKALHIKGCAQKVIDNHEGKVPQTMEKLLTLPGIGRKTANVVLGELFNRSEGVVVDTHVMRLAQRIGMTDQKNPEKIEFDLMKKAKKKDWIPLSNLLIRHGRKYCTARKPKCLNCPIEQICLYGGKNK